MRTTYDTQRQEIDETEEMRAELHNAQAIENYQILLEENRQWETIKKRNEARMSTTIAPERPIASPAPVQTQQHARIEQAPVVTEYPRNVSDVFRQGTMEKVLSRSAIETPVSPVTEIYNAPVQETLVEETPDVEMAEEYGISSYAKKILLSFCAVVTVMMAVIGMNSQIIRQKNMRINQLEERRQELLEENAEIQARIEKAQSEETIRQYAESHGMVMGE